MADFMVYVLSYSTYIAYRNVTIFAEHLKLFTFVELAVGRFWITVGERVKGGGGGVGFDESQTFL